jgi:hypothetical protein
MADITKCTGEGCPMRAGCYRFTAPASRFAQSYFVTPPVKDGECEYFWPERDEEKDAP